MRQLFQNRVMVSRVPAKLEWQNRKWLEAVGLIVCLAGILAITFSLLIIL